ncbi:MAG: molybdopterin converting factor subunit 1 [Alphaproteobacteria bacterium]|nr:molybdopterin converting factor subunit 1 [Alphaproteobacteria bacterium]
MKLVYFAWVRQHIGTAEEELSPPAEVATVEQLLDWLEAQSEGHAKALADRKVIRVAVNQDFAAPDHPVGPNDEVALFPPVTGG